MIPLRQIEAAELLVNAKDFQLRVGHPGRNTASGVGDAADAKATKGYGPKPLPKWSASFHDCKKRYRQSTIRTAKITSTSPS